MAKYRKKPVVIEAWQFTKENYKKGAPHWVKYSNRKVELWSQYGGSSIEGEIETLEGNHEVSENDWILMPPLIRDECARSIKNQQFMVIC